MRWRRDTLAGTVPMRVRGGFSLGSVLTGWLVALSSNALFAVCIGQILVARGYELPRIVRADPFWASAGAGGALVVCTFLSYLWGGYTAGRMSRGAGFLHGVLVAILTILAGAVLGYLAVALRGVDALNVPFGVGNLPLDANLNSLGVGLTAAVALAILIGASWGGVMGARWHTKLEGLLPQLPERDAPDDTFNDLREGP
jgi:hypothetical protein